MQLFYYWYFFARFAFASSHSPSTVKKLPLSIVICAKNEAQNLLFTIPKILQQAYPSFEIVLVDDHSTDETAIVMSQLATEHENIKIVTKENVPDRTGKKAALAVGVQHSNFEHIVVTDADCYPNSTQWLAQIAASFKQKNELVLGLAPNEKDYRFWNNFFRFETYITALQYGSSALRNMPYMGVGRNMAYTKAFFEQQFPAVLNTKLASGDDDLLVNKGAISKQTTLLLSAESFMLSAAPKNFSSWFRQKTRHLSAGFAYQQKHKILLSLFPISFLLFLLSSVFLLLSPLKAFAVIGLLAYLVTIAIIHGFGLRKFHCEDLVLEAPLYLLIWHFLLPIITFASLVKPNVNWKE